MSRRVRPALQRSRVLIRATLIIIVLFFFYSPLVRPSAARSLALGYYILISIEHTYSRIATQLYRTQCLTLLRCCCTATVQIPDKCILCACCKYLRRSWQQRPPSRLWLIDFIVYLYASFTSCFSTLASHSLTITLYVAHYTRQAIIFQVSIGNVRKAIAQRTFRGRKWLLHRWSARVSVLWDWRRFNFPFILSSAILHFQIRATDSSVGYHHQPCDCW